MQNEKSITEEDEPIEDKTSENGTKREYRRCEHTSTEGEIARKLYSKLFVLYRRTTYTRDAVATPLLIVDVECG